MRSLTLLILVSSCLVAVYAGKIFSKYTKLITYKEMFHLQTVRLAVRFEEKSSIQEQIIQAIEKNDTT